MNACRTRGLAGSLAIAALYVAAATTTVKADSTPPGTTRNLLLWDTLSPLGEKLTAEERANWKAVPNDLLLLEKDPLKASSDPGYYGRDFSFKGDAVVETPALAAVFWSTKGCVTIYSKQDAPRKDEHSESAGWVGGKVVDVCPILEKSGTLTINHIEVLRNADDEVLLKASFSPSGSPESAAVFSFDKTGIVHVKPAGNLRNVRLSGSIEYGVVPAFVGDDLIYGGSESSGTNTLAIPTESLFLGLLPGESTELLMTWPKGKQRMSARLEEEQGKKRIKSIDFYCDAQSFFLTVLTAPGIWHKEALTPENLEKDVRIEWRRPFQAKWRTQLYEEDLRTTFAFRESRGEIWRGVAGSFVYPVWFSGDDAFYHFGKKVQPKGEALIYCLEGRETPLTFSTPADILKQTLGRQAAEPILDVAGRKLRTHHRRGATGVRRACTCGCTEAIQAVFESGEEVSQKDYIQEALDDMIFFVHCHVERINEYRQFADGLLKTIQEERRSSADLRPFLDSVEEIARQIPQECEVQKENMKTFAYADELSKKTMELTSKKDTNNVKAYMELLKAWRAMGGAQDSVLAKCHVITRHLCLAAGYGCATQPEAVFLAEEIRARCRQRLRNPDGYEVWADY